MLGPLCEVKTHGEDDTEPQCAEYARHQQSYIHVSRLPLAPTAARRGAEDVMI